MASAALQSYLQPTAGTKFMAQGDWNTTTQYFTSKELLQIFTSVARINIEKLTDASGNILKVRNMLSGSTCAQDPHCWAHLDTVMLLNDVLPA